MFKRISIILLILCTLLAFTIGAGATAAGLFIEKDAANTYIDYVDADGTSIMLIDDTTGVTIAVGTVTSLTAVTTYTAITVTSTTDATSITTGSITTVGGVSIADQLWLGDDIDMSTNITGIYDITLKDGQADGLSIVAGSTDMIVFTTATDAILITPPLTVTGLVTLNGGLTLGADGAGFDVIFYGDNSGSDFFWDQDGDTDASLTLGTTGGTKGVDFTVYGEANGTYLKWDRSVDDLVLAGTVTRIILAGTVDTSLTDASIVTSGGIACTKQLWLGDDIDMTTSGTGVYDISLKDTVDDALSIVGGSTEMMLFDTDTDQITFTPEILLKDDIDMQTSSTGVYDLTLKDTQADALSIVGGSTDMMVFKTNTDQIIITPEVLFTDDLDLSTSTTGVYDLTLKDNMADALSVTDGDDFIVFCTTTGSNSVTYSVPIAVSKTYSSVGTYNDMVGMNLTLSTDLTTGKYLDILYIGHYGASNVDSGGAYFPLWIDITGTGTNSGVFYMARFSVQAAAMIPNAYIQFQTASPGVAYLFKITGDLAPYYGDAGEYTTADGHLLIDTPDGARRIALYAAVD